MIASIPVGGWTWDVECRGGEAQPVAGHGLDVAVAVWGVLHARRLALDVADVRTVTGTGAHREESAGTRISLASVRGAAVGADPRPFPPEALTRETTAVSVLLGCPGEWSDGERHIRAEKLSTVMATCWTNGDGNVTLSTYGDLWLTHDLRGRPQPALHGRYAPLLRATLGDVSALLGGEADPGDSTWYATPTVTGFDAIPDEDPELLDAWDDFEVPYRRRAMLAQVREAYADFTESPVRFAEVRAADGVLGYLWWSDADAAAGFEPRSAMGDRAFAAGARWMRRLEEAKKRGFPPSRAAELGTDAAAEAGTLAPAPWTTALLPDLQEMSGRG
ncbi:hypothetical protein V1J52_22705 [Streptomyces sp. TRM 70351]|uniref:hypothetical protein n=1 Tax=Streptomyces sp. TRM 70351 TaxID=3116552 RepID=UPI002E7BCC6C|nr:hypothetical protein [Streptomyces sp. TRM 70351]MEE1930953.1 hypothetical protein [Streptomyces sp. TRM 70351]